MIKNSIFLSLLLSITCFGLTTQSQATQTWDSQDIGSVGTTGTSSYDAPSGTFTVQGAGSAVGNTADSFQFTYLPVAGNTEIITRVVSQTNTSNYATSGVMMRESANPDSISAMISVSPANGVNFTYRSATSGGSVTVLGPSMTAPVWLRLVRSGSTFAGYQSADGANWTLVGKSNFTMANSFLAGLAVCSNVYGTLSTGVFDNVSAFSLVPQVNANLKLWLRSDVNVTLSGSNQVSRWQDQSDNGNDAVQLSGTQQPLFVSGALNGKPVIRFDGVNDVLKTATSDLMQGCNDLSLVVVTKPAASQVAYAQILDYYSDVTNPLSGFVLEQYNTSTNQYQFAWINSGAWQATTTLAGLSSSQAQMLSAVKSGTTQAMYVSGTQVASAAVPATMTGAAHSLGIGADVASPVYWYQGDIAEIMVYNRALSTSERQDLEAYVYQKYGVGTQPVTAAPVLNIPTGTYPGTTGVTITGTTGANIYYTTDGSTPTAGSALYTGPINVTSTETIKAIAVRNGYAASSVVSSTIAIDSSTFGVSHNGLKLWLRADAINAASGSSISQWTDQSGNGLDATQGTSANQPTLQTNVLNGKPVVRFDGVNDWFTATATDAWNANSHSVLFVLKPNTTTNSNQEFYSTGGWGQFVFHTTSTGSVYVGTDVATRMVPGSGGGQIPDGTVSTGTSQLFEYVFNSGTAAFYKNGAKIASKTGMDLPSSWPGFILGTSDSNTINGDVAEVLVYNTALSDMERQDLEAYVYQKYGVGTQPVTAAPALSSLAATYSGTTSVMITGTTGANIYYTTDGSTPTTSSALYTVPINVTSTETIKAIAVRNGYATSPVTSVTITIDANSGNVARNGLQLWLRADTGVTLNGSTVSGWADQSGNGAVATQSVGGCQPQYVGSGLNGMPVIHFNGTSSVLQTGTSDLMKGSNDVSMVIVTRPGASQGAWADMLDYYSTNPGTGFALDQNNTTTNQYTFLWYSGGQWQAAGAVAALSSGTGQIFSAIKSGTSDALYLNGTQVATAGVPASMDQGVHSIGIGGQITPAARWYQGDIAEVLIYNRALSTGERQDIEAYIYQKYGVGTQLVTAAPNVSVPTGTYVGGTSMTITGPVGATIYYTTDGSTPTTGSTLYTGAINVTSTETIKAIAAKNGYAPSPVTSVTITIDSNSANVTRSGLQAWYRADVGVALNGATVKGWVDQSGNGRDATQGTTAYQPQYVTSGTNVLNGKPVVHFDGVNDLLLTGASNLMNGSNDVSVVVVTKPAASQTAYANIFDYTCSAATDFVFQQNNTASNQFYFTWVNNGVWQATGAVVNLSSSQAQILAVVKGGTNQTLYVSGSQAATATVPAAMTTGVNGFGIGNRAAGASYPYQGDIAEILVYNRALSTGERQDIEAYVYQKYGVGAQPVTAAPNVSVPTGTYVGGTSVTITGPADATIYYTTDGSTPTTGSTLYTGTISVTSTETIKAIAVKNGYAASSVVSSTITIDSNSANVTRSGLQAWYRADVGVALSGSTVSQWADQSGNGAVASQANGSMQPLLVSGTLNGKPVIRFDGVNDLLQTGTSNLIQGGNDMSVVVVAKPAASQAAFAGMLDYDIASGGFVMQQNNATINQYYLTWLSGGVWQGTGAVVNLSSSQAQIFSVVKGGTTQMLYLSGTQAASVTVSGTMTSAAHSFGIGSRVSVPQYPFQGDIAEILIYNRALSASELQGVNAYVYQKYGVGTQPVTAAPVLSTPTGTYSGTTSVTITGTSGANIYYTTDGSTPTTSSTHYAGAITVSGTTTIKAMAVIPGGGYASSPVVSATITVDSNSNSVTRSGLQAWYRADVGVALSGSTVSQWADQSGNGAVASQANGTQQPLFVGGTLNGKPVIRFDGINDLLQTAASDLMQGSNDVSVVVVTKPAASQVAYALILDYYSDVTNPLSGFSLGQYSTLTNQYHFVWANSGAWQATTTLASLSNSQAQVLSAVKSGTTQTIYVSGTQAALATVPATMTGGVHSLGIGAQVASAAYWYQGDIAEILVYNRALSDSERLQLEYYLNQKYAVIQNSTLVAPQFSVSGGTLSGPAQVSISAPTGSTVYYTTDGSDPTTSSFVYTGPIDVNYTQTIKAKAFQNGYPTSSTTTVTYTLDPNQWPGPTYDPNDHTPPIITLQLPTNAVLQ